MAFTNQRKMARAALVACGAVWVMACGAWAADESGPTDPTALDTEIEAWVALGTTVNGNTYTINPGTYSLTREINIFGKAVNIKGSGIDQTIILDNLPGSTSSISSSNSVFDISLATGETTTLSYFTIRKGTRSRKSSAPNGGMINVNGGTDGNTSGERFVAGFIKFDRPNGEYFVTENVFGVIHNCIFWPDDNHRVLYGLNTRWDGHSFGDGSWVDPPNYGSDEFLFIENCKFDRRVYLSNEYSFLDGDGGMRVVVRNNDSWMAHFSNHGTESSGKRRGGAVMEIYRNTDDTTGASRANTTFVKFRSGTGLVWGNSATNDPGRAERVNFQLSRLQNNFSDWGIADGRDEHDLNDDGNNPYASGTVTSAGAAVAPDGSDCWFTDNTKTGPSAWATDQWKGFMVRRIGGGSGATAAYVTGNNGDTVFYDTNSFDPPKGQGNMVMAAEVTYEFNKVLRVMDQPGTLGGSLYTTSDRSPPPGWHDQPDQPIYIWDNDGNGSPMEAGGITSSIVEGENFFDPSTPSGFTLPGTSVGTDRNSLSPTAGDAGIAYWETDEGEWDSTNGATPDGRLYVWNGSAWELYYTPYTYPHPLRLSTTGASPVVSISSPTNESEHLLGVSITFTASATDAEDGDLAASLSWTSSIDGPIGTGASFSSTALSVGSHTVSATVADSDDNTGVGQVDFLVYETTNNIPVVSITSPTDGIEIAEFDTVQLTATATDVEDGDLSSQISWDSSIQGFLGTGSSFESAPLVVGEHLITASVTDSANNPGLDAVNVDVVFLSSDSNQITVGTLRVVGDPVNTPLIQESYQSAPSGLSVSNSSDRLYVASSISVSSSFTATSIELWLSRTNNPSGTFTVEIRSALAGTVLGSASVSTPSIHDTGDWERFDFSEFAITPGTYYVVAYNSNTNGSQYIRWGAGNLSSGSSWRSADGSTWNSSENRQGAFQLYGY